MAKVVLPALGIAEIKANTPAGKIFLINHLNRLVVTFPIGFGGVGQKPQVDGIRRGAEILVATPGRLLDLMQQGHAPADGVEALALDEGDRMLDMGFIQPIRRIVAAVPRQRQTMLFSATLPPDIVALASGMLHNPATVSVTPTASTAEKVSQWVLHVQSNNKRNLLAEVLRDRAMARVLVFTRTKHGANRVAPVSAGRPGHAGYRYAVVS